jgi:hypothetical protein
VPDAALARDRKGLVNDVVGLPHHRQAELRRCLSGHAAGHDKHAAASTAKCFLHRGVVEVADDPPRPLASCLGRCCSVRIAARLRSPNTSGW